MKPGEITEASIRRRLRMAVDYLLSRKADDASTAEQLTDNIYKDSGSNWAELIGVVEKATAEERQRAANTARRLGHTQTAQVIREGR